MSNEYSFDINKILKCKKFRLRFLLSINQDNLQYDTIYDFYHYI